MPATDYTITHPALEPFTVARPGCEVHGWEAGPTTATTVIMHHGATADHRMFNAQVEPLLRAGFRVLTIDGRGHGLSRPMLATPTIDDYASDYLAILDDRGIDRAIYLGQSLGAYVAQHAVNRAPERCLALVVVGTTLISIPVSRTDAIGLRASITAFRLWPWKHLTRLTSTSTARQPAVRAYMAECVNSLGRHEFLRIWHAVNTAVSTDGFPALPPDLAILWTHGDDDRAGNIVRDIPAILTQDLSGLEYHVIPHASHNANQDNPEDFNARLLTFLSGLPSV
ncbi:MAG: alpha/beta fold hydrolase [Dietzia sp.]